jgi:hypothetical protein
MFEILHPIQGDAMELLQRAVADSAQSWPDPGCEALTVLPLSFLAVTVCHLRAKLENPVAFLRPILIELERIQALQHRDDVALAIAGVCLAMAAELPTAERRPWRVRAEAIAEELSGRESVDAVMGAMLSGVRDTLAASRADEDG